MSLKEIGEVFKAMKIYKMSSLNLVYYSYSTLPCNHYRSNICECGKYTDGLLSLLYLSFLIFLCN